MLDDQFINIKLTRQNLHLYAIRTSILNAIDKNLKFLEGDLLDLGCGKMPYKEYILKNSNVKKYIGLDINTALDYSESIKPDLYWDGVTIPVQTATYDCAIATEVLEHCNNPDQFMEETYRVLKEEGYFFFTVPFIWNLHEVPHDEYRYTPFALERIMRNAGFSDIKLYATGGWHASLAQMLGLWVKRCGLTKSKERAFSLILKPIIKFLLKKDRKVNVLFREGQMITGIYGVAKK
tara:strand:- start:97 stop:804 length:708 start_codon:yes stop_codon:yes gene_type:complete